jgi:DNA polymerase I-like protein with 3'-5' exonuclease and polymerase domains
MIMSQVIWAGVGVFKAGKGENRSERCKLSHGLKGFAERLGFEVDKTQQTSAWGWSLSNAQINYAATDVRILFPMFHAMRQMILDQGLIKTAFIECNAVSVFANMEYFGMPVDLNKAKATLAQYRERQKELEAIINEHFPGKVYTSNPQMLEAFRAKWPEANLESVSKDAIGGIDHPAIKAFLEVKPLNTDIAYIEGVIKNSFRGSIRCMFRQIAGSGSGRSACSQNITVNRKKYPVGAQLQNPSKNFRHIFTSEDPNIGLGIYDSSGSHMRIATQYCKDPLLLKIFTDDFDGHSILASDIAKMCGDDFSPEYIMDLKAKKDLQDEGKYELTDSEKKDVKKALKTYRNLAKTLLYSSLNGSGVATMLTAIHKVGMSWATEEDAKKIRDLFYSRYPELIKLIKSTPKEASKHSFDFSHFLDYNGQSIGDDWGLVKALGGRHIYMKKMDGLYGKQVPFNDAVSALWLATEADGMKKFLYEIQNKFWETPEWNANVVHMSHDEALFTYEKLHTKAIAEFVVGTMNEVFSEYVNVIPALDGATLNNPTNGMKTSWDEK